MVVRQVRGQWKWMILGVILGSPSYAGTKKEPNSDIPERREFPLSPEVKPCDDFYRYTCDEVSATFKLREDRSAHTFSFSDSHERLLKAKQKYLEDLLAGKTKAATARAKDLQTVFQACMNEKGRAEEEKSYVQSIAKEIKGVSTLKDLQGYMARKFATADFAGLEFSPTSNLDDPSVYDGMITGDFRTLPERDFYEKPEVITAYQEVITQFFTTLGLDHPADRAKAVVELETGYSKVFPLRADVYNRVIARTEISREQLISRYPNLAAAPMLEKIPNVVKLRDPFPETYAWLNTELQDGKVESWKNLFLWRSLEGIMDDGYPEFHGKYFEFRNKFLGGPVKRPVRAERCTSMVMGNFTKEIDAELVDQLFPDFPTEKFVKMTEKIRGAIVDGIQDNPWLSPEARKAGANKMKVATLQVVKPRNDDEWDFNPPATYDPARPLHNEQMLNNNLIQRMIERTKKPRNPHRWGMGPLTVNAYYSPSDNKFVMPIGILQYPFYDPKGPDEANFGAIGAVIGHELGHGIDDHGARFDEKGRLKQWMTDKDLEEFKKRTARMVAQFDATGHKGELTLGENIGDLVGVTAAYRAAFPNGKGSIEAKKAFFTQYGRAWCTVMRPKRREMLMATDEHSMGDARVNEQVKHQSGFAEAFSCKAGDKMYLAPKDRLKIW